jgi:hypothetical protein
MRSGTLCLNAPTQHFNHYTHFWWKPFEIIPLLAHSDLSVINYHGSMMAFISKAFILRCLRSSDDDMCNRERIFKNQKNKVTALIRTQNRNFINSLVQMAIGNSKKMWAILKLPFHNTFSACTVDLPNELTDITGQTVTDPPRIMDLLNDYFATIAENLKENLLHENFNQPTTLTMTYDSDRSILIYPTTRTDIKSIIDGLKNDAASGLDDCSSKMLKRL